MYIFELHEWKNSPEGLSFLFIYFFITTFQQFNLFGKYEERK